MRLNAAHLTIPENTLYLQNMATETLRSVVYNGSTYIPGAWGGYDQFAALAEEMEINIVSWNLLESEGTHATIYRADGRVIGRADIASLDAWAADQPQDTIHIIFNGDNHYETFERPLHDQARWNFAPGTRHTQVDRHCIDGGSLSSGSDHGGDEDSLPPGSDHDEEANTDDERHHTRNSSQPSSSGDPDTTQSRARHKGRLLQQFHRAASAIRNTAMSAA